MRPFDPEQLVRTRVAGPLADAIRRSPAARHPVVIERNVALPDNGRVFEDLTAGCARLSASGHYAFGLLTATEIRDLLARDTARAIHRIWPDFEVRAAGWDSLATVKADAARRAFAASGEGITWAVVDSGIDARHPHFALHRNLAGEHYDLTAGTVTAVLTPEDPAGHGTHVAGILAGELPGTAPAWREERDERGDVLRCEAPVEHPRGVAPRCRLVSYRVLDEAGRGPMSRLIQALEHIAERNGHGRRLVIHGVNLSVGYEFDAEWFACGQSPLCVEVDRLVRSGVAVVAAAGNTGNGAALSINDPGNAELAVTVGATHRDMPHVYGVSYFSSKGPTGDGRRKPDLVAPGERIVSCQAGSRGYVERSGTSMAAPHVSGAIAAFLSVRPEFIGRPLEVKRLFLASATDLGRERYFQGAGLLDLLRALQAV
jgi:subtilisin family serine protease